MDIIESLRNGTNSPEKGEFVFQSSNHIRYQNGHNVSGHNCGCHRSIKIQNNILGFYGYTVTIFNDDAIHPLWRNNVQMAPKQMKIERCGESDVLLRGFGMDPMGFSFSDYAMTIFFENNRIKGCVLHLLDRGIDIEYI